MAVTRKGGVGEAPQQVQTCDFFAHHATLTRFLAAWEGLAEDLYSNLIPWARGRSLLQLMVLVCRRM